MKKQPRIERSCQLCSKTFLVRQYILDIGKGLFCSRKCSDKSPKRPKVHRDCKWCGTEFSVWQCAVESGGGVYCSPKCSSQSSRVVRLERKCKTCSAPFLVTQAKLDSGRGIYCSKKCSIEKPKAWKAVTCGCCGKVFTDKTCQKPKYCSPKCYQKSRPKAAKLPKRRGHEKWMLAVILRDKKCVRCGAHENLQAHHLKNWKHHPELRCDVSNGVALCPLCHHAQHPYLPLEGFIASGGKKVKYCVVCETAFLVRKKTQRVCSRKCGWKRKAMMERAPA